MAALAAQGPLALSVVALTASMWWGVVVGEVIVAATMVLGALAANAERLRVPWVPSEIRRLSTRARVVAAASALWCLALLMLPGHPRSIALAGAWLLAIDLVVLSTIGCLFRAEQSPPDPGDHGSGPGGPGRGPEPPPLAPRPSSTPDRRRELVGV